MKQVSADSLQVVVREAWTEPVPQEVAKLAIPLSELTSLPETAEFRAKNGRASATVRHKGDTLVVYATCDSLQRQCFYYARQLSITQEALEKQAKALRTVQNRSPYPWQKPLIAFIAGVAIGILLTNLLTKTEIWRRQF